MLNDINSYKRNQCYQIKFLHFLNIEIFYLLIKQIFSIKNLKYNFGFKLMRYLKVKYTPKTNTTKT